MTRFSISRTPLKGAPIAAILIALAFFPGTASRAAAASMAASLFDTPIQASDLDAATFHDYVDGVEGTSPGDKNSPSEVVWTKTSRIGWSGIAFGDSKTPGRRYLRIGFTKPIAIGSILVRGGGELSVLKASAAYPGSLPADDQWVPAMRIIDGVPATTEASRDDYAMWILPPGTVTRALRFTHNALVTDVTFAGWLGGVTILTDRYANVAPMALANARSNGNHAGKINDGTNNETWGAWDNITPIPPTQIVSPTNPEWVTLTWPAPVKLSGLALLWTGFGGGDVQTYSGPSDRNPSEATEADWQTLVPLSGLINGYPVQFWPNWVNFGRTIETRSLRIRMTSVTLESHPHLIGKTEGGKRVWLGEVVALQPLASEPFTTPVTASAVPAAEPHAPIAINFTLATPGFVTLVIEDAAGKRIRNLIASTYFPAGKNTTWWDGTDDLKRDTDAAAHGYYSIPREFVAPGAYRVRGLVRPQIDLRYEFSVNSSGNPPWSTQDGTGGWLTTHTPGQAALYIPPESSPSGKPMIYIGCYIAEGGSGLMWLDQDGNKLGGRTWVGGNWTAAPFLARDAGSKAVRGDVAYVAAAWKNDDGTGEIRLTALTAKDDRNLPVVPFDIEKPAGPSAPKIDAVQEAVGGLAAYDGLLVVSQPHLNSLLVVDASSGRVINRPQIDNPRGVAFDASGALLVLSGTKLIRFAGDLGTATALTAGQTLVSSGLEDPHGITVGPKGQIYVGDWGDSHQVKVYSPSGELVRTIGHPGKPAAGPYDPLHMNHPEGMTIDGNDHLWVTENDFQPKRISVWDHDGKLLNAYYGPARYGGGGTLDSHDKSIFYYGGMAFKVDWATGKSAPSAIIWRPDDDAQEMPGAAPELALYHNGKQYFTNCYNSNPTNGAAIAVLFRSVNGLAVPCDAIGRANDWPLLKTVDFAARWPSGVDPSGDMWKNQALFIWSDTNGDGIVQPNEVTMKAADIGGATIMPDLTLVESRIDGSMTSISPTRFTDSGCPVYQLESAKIVVDGAQKPTSSGGDQALIGQDGWSVLTIAPKPYAPQGLGGTKNGVPMWSYPSVWPGLHASHSSAVPTLPGELIGTTRLLGGFVTPKRGAAGPLWAINGNMGDMYLFTQDGLFVSQLFQDIRQGKPWGMPVAQRGMLLNDVSLHDENFFPTLNQVEDGGIYIVDGARNAVVSVGGLEQIKRIPPQDLTVSAKDMVASQAYFVAAEAARQQRLGGGTLNVRIVDTAPTMDGSLKSWPSDDWAVIDRSGTAANFNSNSKPYDVTASVVLTSDKLYAAWRTGDRTLLANSGNEPNAPFKTGGALDLQIEAAPGGERLLVTRKGAKTWAVLYRAKVPGTTTPVSFSSPWRTIKIDKVDDVSGQVQLVDNGTGNYVIAVPLSLLGITPQAGIKVRADIGILRGDGAQTLQRVYWNNKATAITSDVPSEAELTPNLWGKWTFTK